MGATEGLKVDVTKTFKMIMLDKDLKQYEVGQRLGMKDRQPFNRLLQKNDGLRINEVVKIADSMNCEVKISLVDKDTGKEWQCDIVGSVSEA
ncbi:MAG: hypothetical protein LBU32_11880 [Clostridiales bacterium]|jgi:hypothetical protein|nr:hypothetical protein [Clostridiales bacterium]